MQAELRAGKDELQRQREALQRQIDLFDDYKSRALRLINARSSSASSPPPTPPLDPTAAAGVSHHRSASDDAAAAAAEHRQTSPPPPPPSSAWYWAAATRPCGAGRSGPAHRATVSRRDTMPPIHLLSATNQARRRCVAGLQQVREPQRLPLKLATTTTATTSSSSSSSPTDTPRGSTGVAVLLREQPQHLPLKPPTATNTVSQSEAFLRQVRWTSPSDIPAGNTGVPDDDGIVLQRGGSYAGVELRHASTTTSRSPPRLTGSCGSGCAAGGEGEMTAAGQSDGCRTAAVSSTTDDACAPSSLLGASSDTRDSSLPNSSATGRHQSPSRLASPKSSPVSVLPMKLAEQRPRPKSASATTTPTACRNATCSGGPASAAGTVSTATARTLPSSKTVVSSARSGSGVSTPGSCDAAASSSGSEPHRMMTTRMAAGHRRGSSERTTRLTAGPRPSPSDRRAGEPPRRADTTVVYF